MRHRVLWSIASRVCPRGLPGFALITGAILITACRESPSTVPAADAGPLVADTAGLRIVNDTAASWGNGSPWTVGVAPTLDIGSPAQALLGVADPVWLSDGRVVVVNASKQQILYFAPSGALLVTAGGPGVDQGQFHGLGWVGLAPADTIVAFDFVSNRFSLFDAKGKFVRGFGLPLDSTAVGPEPLASYPDGSVLVRLGRARPFVGKPGAVRRDSASYVRVGLDGVVRVTIGTFPQSESFGVMAHGKTGPTTPFPVPFGLLTAVAVRGDTTLIGTSASFEIASFGPAGAPVGLLRAAIARPPVTAEEKAAFTTAAISRLRTASVMMKTPLDSGLLAAVSGAPFPANKPAFGRFVVDATGALWVSDPLTPPQPPTNWNIFAPDGTWLGSVVTPAGFRVDVIGQNAMLGVWRAPHGDERVQVYPIFRGAGS